MLTNILYALITTHITIAMVTIYLHRAQAHRSLKLNYAFDVFCRIWLWLFTGQVTTEWVAVHRKHHAKCETIEDPHSPQTRGLWTVLFKGVWLYKKEASNPETIKKYSLGCPTDKLEAFFFKYSWLGLVITASAQFMILGYHAIWIYLMQILWIPFWAAGVINGVAHWTGYRNFETKDASRNISPIGFIVGGEELHNNHHSYPTSAKLSMKKWEFDIGWFYIQILEKLGIARDVKAVYIPQQQSLDSSAIAMDSKVMSFFQHQSYYRKLFDKGLKSTVQKEISIVSNALEQKGIVESKYKLYKIFQTPVHMLEKAQKYILDVMLEASEKLRNIYRIKQDLLNLWEDKKLQLDEAKKKLNEWCVEAHKHYRDDLMIFFNKSSILSHAHNIQVAA